ncbi:aminodeoxychorismate synthase chloroplastic [Phtheirospermum japonicum]|uniref:p-aminobenzoic acid synthase n=1 Tax=Phtheirospermum japonicum TaxID=374723 RepID=A0A830B743_9LAMI|nr:aminodeoxychorismate synthase chloroplastic [Phtheirospermum japonicum]
MGFTLCSSSTEISFSCLESICQNKSLKSLVPKAFSRLSDLNRKNRHCGIVRKTFVSCHLVPGQLEGSFIVNKKLHEPPLKLEFVRTLLIDNYDSYTYNIYQELSVINGLPPVVIRNDEWSWEDVCYYLYEEKAFDNIVISPGPGSPTCPSDIGICLRLLLECSDIPILGVCLGHQALGYVHGAHVIHAPEPIHGRLSDIEHNNCGLFNGIPSGQNSGFKVVRYHSLVIDPTSLRRELIPIAWTSSSETIPSFRIEKNIDSYNGAFERQDGSHSFSNSLSAKSENGLQRHCPKSQEMKNGNILMGIMHSSRPHYGLQFHPESIATCHGRQIFKNFAEITKDYWFGLRSSSDSKRKVHYSVTLSSELYLACTQVPNVTQLFQDVARLGFDVIADYESYGICRAELAFHLWGVKEGHSGDNDMAFNHGGHLSIEDADGNITTNYLEDGFFDFLNQLRLVYEVSTFPDLGGSSLESRYDLKVECGAQMNRHKSSAPDACLFFTDNLVVIDHHCEDIYVMSILDQTPNTTPWMDNIEQKLLNMKLYPPRIYKKRRKLRVVSHDANDEKCWRNRFVGTLFESPRKKSGPICGVA